MPEMKQGSPVWLGDADPVRRFPYLHWAGHRGSSKVSKLRLCSLKIEALQSQE